ncbi:MAG: diphosphate--fructose-6-phosphate 1-phosphotransferase [Terriglobia bacterium]
MSKAQALVAHGGGPTAVLNASLLGTVREGHRLFQRLWAAHGGVAGLLHGEVSDLLSVPLSRIVRLATQPGSMIGSYRGEVTDEHIERIIEFFHRHDIRHFFYTGGNGSMGTALRIARSATAQGYELTTIGIPKTMDNDLCETDHCPGFGSAARFVATAVRDIGLDQRALPTPVSIVEVMGRNTGWLAAASILAQKRKDDPPHFIYVPEHPFSTIEFVERVDQILKKLGWVVGVVAEGLRDASGKMVSASHGSNLDAKGRPLMGGVAANLATLISEKLNVRARSEKPGILGRACSHCRSSVDAREAYEIGRFAAKSAVAGKSGTMVAMRRLDTQKYRVSLELVPLTKVSERERVLPRRYFPKQTAVSQEYRKYVAPLIGDEIRPAEHLVELQQ